MNVKCVHEVPVSDTGQEPDYNFVNEFKSEAASIEPMIFHENVKHQGVGNKDRAVMDISCVEYHKGYSKQVSQLIS